jgi:hypothetical protein
MSGNAKRIKGAKEENVLPCKSTTIVREVGETSSTLNQKEWSTFSHLN